MARGGQAVLRGPGIQAVRRELGDRDDGRDGIGVLLPLRDGGAPDHRRAVPGHGAVGAGDAIGPGVVDDTVAIHVDGLARRLAFGIVFRQRDDAIRVGGLRELAGGIVSENGRPAVRALAADRSERKGQAVHMCRVV